MSDLESDEYQRDAVFRAYHAKYGRHSHSGSCYYCGLPDEVDDHVPPLATVHRLRGFTKSLSLLLVRSCAACNGTLGDMPLMSPEDRRDFIQSEALPRRIADLKSQLQAAELNLQRIRSQLNTLDSIGVQSHDSEAIKQFKDLPIGARFCRVSDARLHEKLSLDAFRTEQGVSSADLGEWVMLKPPNGDPGEGSAIGA